MKLHIAPEAANPIDIERPIGKTQPSQPAEAATARETPRTIRLAALSAAVAELVLFISEPLSCFSGATRR
jgi:hypothetical protein